MKNQAGLGWLFHELRRLDRRVHKTKAMIVFMGWCSQCAGRQEITRLGFSEKEMKRGSPSCDAW